MELMYLRGLGMAVVLLGCGDNRDKPVDARTDGLAADARHGDARAIDARAVDARTIDARTIDAPHITDARTLDAAIDAARITDARSLDAGRAPDATQSTGTPGIVSCYTEGDPAQSCTLPTHCCFSNYSSAHDGFCSNNTCIYGTITCDGPEDCSGGQHCCSHALFDSGGSVNGYAMACQASACGAAPANYELCHQGGPACSNGGTCVTAYLHDNDLPRTLDICQ